MNYTIQKIQNQDKETLFLTTYGTKEYSTSLFVTKNEDEAKKHIEAHKENETLVSITNKKYFAEKLAQELAESKTSKK